MSLNSVAMLIVLGVSLVAGQRSPYAGSRPANGYKDRFTATAAAAAPATAAGTTQTNGSSAPSVGDRLGENGAASSTTVGPTTTTQRLPYDALGDAFAVQQAMLKPQDHQPFWVINQGHIEAHRGGTARPPQAVRPATSGDGVINRFGESDGVAGGVFDPNSINMISKPEIVYPINMPIPVRGQGNSQLGSAQSVPVQNNAPIQQSMELPLAQQQLVQQQFSQQQTEPQPLPQQPIRQQPIPIQQTNRPLFDDQQFQPSDNFYHVAPYFTEFDY